MYAWIFAWFISYLTILFETQKLILLSLFNNSLSDVYMASSRRVTVKGGSGTLLKEVVMAYFNVIFQHLSDRRRKTHLYFFSQVIW
jgi:hypothetical protein